MVSERERLDFGSAFPSLPSSNCLSFMVAAIFSPPIVNELPNLSSTVCRREGT